MSSAAPEQDKVRDKLGMKEAQASMLLRSGKLAESETLYRHLISLNPDNYKMHEGLQVRVSNPEHGLAV